MQGLQEIFRERTFGSYPHAEEIKRLHSREQYNTSERWGPNLGILTPRTDMVDTRLPQIHTDTKGFTSARQPKPIQWKKNRIRRSMSFIGDEGRHPRQQENTKTHFQPSVNVRGRYHFINPEWLSEGLSYKRLYREHRSDPFRYGWA